MVEVCCDVSADLSECDWHKGRMVLSKVMRGVCVRVSQSLRVFSDLPAPHSFPFFCQAIMKDNRPHLVGTKKVKSVCTDGTTCQPEPTACDLAPDYLSMNAVQDWRTVHAIKNTAKKRCLFIVWHLPGGEVTSLNSHTLLTSSCEDVSLKTTPKTDV